MHTTILALALAAAAAASPIEARNAGSMWDQCDAAPNCERYQRSDNKTSIRFVEGMGPGTDWYNTNIQRLDPFHPSNTNNPLLSKRQDSVTFNLESTDETTLYGTANPVDVVNSLYDNCAGSSCNNGPFYYTSTYVTNLGDVTTGTGDTTSERTLQLDPVGSWDGNDPNNRSYFIESLRQMMSSTIVSNEQDWINGGSTGIGGAIQSGTETIWTGAQYVNMNRFVNGGMQGQLSVRITVVPNGNGDCGAITGGLSAVAGAISGIGGGFFGLLGSLICN